jgi:enolase
MTKIQNITAQEILDSRGNPTVMVNVTLNNGIAASACVPSGASTGIREAVELRDGDAQRYGGKGVLKAVANVNKIIAPKLKGKSPHAQKDIDDLMRKLDGTENKSKLGANAILGVSMAVCRAAALDSKIPLYAYIRKLHGGKATAPFILPAPMMNVVNGGAHSTNNVNWNNSRTGCASELCIKSGGSLAASDASAPVTKLRAVLKFAHYCQRQTWLK